ncbi:hypothetical protein MPTK1_2g13110 [Marchantia polymorpha subsp. ruderalis]|uniref:Uncharacterized protein n=1 Tax=Marchantia polymorpha TaxID=3197 RepID=A0A2R6XAS9_MARPO|nr:hypothetical protein MARPO_0026s0061 [Marchantia polymorpha]BBN02138.1 hypothetical protein Mp_2g13110 [Marchantia polymorpha subsp. ruderalis]|eukprot:PTQ43182.1 hypothetical protein MARPO_0026s0061 [Marchantia polymorpha]
MDSARAVLHLRYLTLGLSQDPSVLTVSRAFKRWVVGLGSPRGLCSRTGITVGQSTIPTLVKEDLSSRRSKGASK